MNGHQTIANIGTVSERRAKTRSERLEEIQIKLATERGQQMEAWSHVLQRLVGRKCTVYVNVANAFGDGCSKDLPAPWTPDVETDKYGDEYADYKKAKGVITECRVQLPVAEQIDRFRHPEVRKFFMFNIVCKVQLSNGEAWELTNDTHSMLSPDSETGRLTLGDYCWGHHGHPDDTKFVRVSQCWRPNSSRTLPEWDSGDIWRKSFDYMHLGEYSDLID